MVASFLNAARRLVPYALLFSLAACGGGGGGGGGSTDDFSISTSNVTFVAIQGSTPPIQTVNLTVNRGAVAILATSNSSLFSASFQTTGQATGIITITPVAATFSPGTYTGTVTVRGCWTLNCAAGTDVTGSPKTINVTYRVGADIAASSTSLTFTHVTGSAYPVSQTVNVLTSSGVAWTASTSNSWLMLSSTGGTGPGSIGISVNPGALAVGTYNGTVTLVAPSSGDTETVFVTLNVVVPGLVSNQASLAFSGTYGSPFPAQAVNITMNNGSAVNWTATPSSNWLVLSQTSGTTPSSITVGVDVTGLSAGSYNATITFNGSGLSSPMILNVTLLIITPSLYVNPTSLAFGRSNGGLDANGKTVTLSLNTATNAYGWTANVSDPWIQVMPVSGTVSSTPFPVTVRIDPTGLAEGTYSGTVTFTAQVNGLTVNSILPVQLQLDTHRIVVSDVGVALTSTPTLSRLTRALKVRSSRGADVSWTAASSQSWLGVTSSGTTSDDLLLTADPAGLAADTVHYASVTVTSSDTSVVNSETVRVGFWVGSTTPLASTQLPGSSPPIAVDPIRPYVYRSGGGDIVVSNLYTGAVVTTITVPNGASLGEATIANDGSRMFVVDNINHQVLPIDLSTFTFGTGWATGASTAVGPVYVRSNGIGVLVVGNGRFFDPGTGIAYGTTFTPLTTNGIDRVRTSRDGSRVCNQDMNRVPYTIHCFALYVTSSVPGEVQLGPTKFALGPASEFGYSVRGTDFAINNDGTRVFVPSHNCCGSGRGEFRVYDPTTTLQAMPLAQTISQWGNPNNAEVGPDGRVFLGSEDLGYNSDTWVYDGNGTYIRSFELSDPYGSFTEGSIRISGDGLRALAYSSYLLQTRITTVGQ